MNMKKINVLKPKFRTKEILEQNRRFDPEEERIFQRIEDLRREESPNYNPEMADDLFDEWLKDYHPERYAYLTRTKKYGGGLLKTLQKRKYKKDGGVMVSVGITPIDEDDVSKLRKALKKRKRKKYMAGGFARSIRKLFQKYKKDPDVKNLADEIAENRSMQEQFLEDNPDVREFLGTIREMEQMHTKEGAYAIQDIPELRRKFGALQDKSHKQYFALSPKQHAQLDDMGRMVARTHDIEKELEDLLQQLDAPLLESSPKRKETHDVITRRKLTDQDVMAKEDPETLALMEEVGLGKSKDEFRKSMELEHMAKSYGKPEKPSSGKTFKEVEETVQVGFDELSIRQLGDEAAIILTRKSDVTGEVNSMKLPVDIEKFQKDLDIYQNQDMFIQDAFKYLDPEQREFVKTGITPDEWDELFPDGTKAAEAQLGMPINKGEEYSEGGVVNV